MFDLMKPYEVTVGEVQFFVMNADDQVPASFFLMASTAPQKSIIRIAGGCRGMDEDDKTLMLEYFLKAFDGFAGVAFTGATRELNKDGSINMMVTDMAGAIAASNPGCIALGTAPRTYRLRMIGESHLIVSEYGAIPNPDQAGALYIQADPEKSLDWDGDLAVYQKIMMGLHLYADFKAGLVVWNGGAVTKVEAQQAAAKGWPVILIAGSGRMADQLAEDKDFIRQMNVHTVNTDPEELQALLLALGFIIK